MSSSELDHFYALSRKHGRPETSSTSRQNNELCLKKWVDSTVHEHVRRNVEIARNLNRFGLSVKNEILILLPNNLDFYKYGNF